MKHLVKLFLLISFIYNFSYALTPFSLEGLKSVNIAILNKGKLVSKQTIEKIKKDLTHSLTKLGIQTHTLEFSNFLIKIDAKKIKKKFAVHVSLLLVESVNPIRDKKLINTAITYQQSDFFITDELEDDVYESAVEFLLPLFEEQYLEEKE
ncbi:hypothetical protein [Sulfurospirillum arcachonense]|uniref:hypothetical protein n=1 Tax=Sulfurospirillum arcachonense TaxID=57666 RepID=UPI0004689D04|nr:hypothetical protein [Sulfurospirillum arcachonense]